MNQKVITYISTILAIIVSAIAILSWLAGKQTLPEYFASEKDRSQTQEVIKDEADINESKSHLINLIESGNYDLLVDVSGSMNGFGKTRFWYGLIRLLEDNAVNKYGVGDMFFKIDNKISFSDIPLNHQVTDWANAIESWIALDNRSEKMIFVTDGVADIGSDIEKARDALSNNKFGVLFNGEYSE